MLNCGTYPQYVYISWQLLLLPRWNFLPFVKFLNKEDLWLLSVVLVQTAGWSSPYQWADTGMSWAGEQMGADRLGASVGRPLWPRRARERESCHVNTHCQHPVSRVTGPGRCSTVTVTSWFQGMSLMSRLIMTWTSVACPVSIISFTKVRYPVQQGGWPHLIRLTRLTKSSSLWAQWEFIRTRLRKSMEASWSMGMSLMSSSIIWASVTSPASISFTKLRYPGQQGLTSLYAT